MKRIQTAVGLRTALLGALIAAACPMTALGADDDQAEREARRLENEIRRQDAQARRDIEDRNRIQAEALRSQEESIRRMEATQARMLADSQERERQATEQSRIYFYPYYPDRATSTPTTPIPTSPEVSPVAPYPPTVGSTMRSDPVSRINFASTQAGVLIVSAGGGALFGLQGGDLILSIDGRVPVDGSHAAAILRSYRRGEPVKLRVQRDRRVLELAAIAP
jgi:hypothetical protein